MAVPADIRSDGPTTAEKPNADYLNLVKKHYHSEKAYSMYNVLAMFFVCVVMGVPIWWKTTSVYRSELPYSQIDQLKKYQPVLIVDTEVVLLEDLDRLRAIQFGELLQKRLAESLQGNLEIKIKGRMRIASDAERKAFLQSKSLKDFESVSQTDSRSLGYNLWVIPKATVTESLPCAGTLGNIYVEKGNSDEDTVSRLEKVLHSLINQPWLEKQYESEMGQVPLDNKPDTDRMRALQSSAAYSVVFTLLVPEPDKVHADWDMAAGVQDYLSSFETIMSPYLNVTFKSQVLYYTGISKKPKRQNDGTWILSSTDLPSLINPIEGRLSNTILGSFVTTDPILNFLTYIPTVATSPLHILQSDGSKLPTNAFLIPRWGGFHVYNMPSGVEPSAVPVMVDNKKIMGVFLPQLRALVGIHKLTAEIHTLSVGNRGLADWELQGWLREKCLENIAKSTVALSSLSRLVEQVRNMVINDDIGQQVQEAVEKLTLSHSYLSSGKLDLAYQASEAALISSEKAFFDPSLLELLYFPEDQKFAIYIPLFLPAGLPIFSSLLNAFTFYFGKKKSVFKDDYDENEPKEQHGDEQPEPEKAAEEKAE